MHLLSIVLFALSSNLDSFVVGMSYGVKQVRIGLRPNLLIGGITFIGTALSMVCGKGLLRLIPVRAASILGSAVIILIGVYCLGSYLLRVVFHPAREERGAAAGIKLLSNRAAAILGIGLTVNNMGLGIGASIAGLSVFTTSLCSLLSSLLFLWSGNRLGHRLFTGGIGRYAEPAASVIIIVLGVYELFV